MEPRVPVGREPARRASGPEALQFCLTQGSTLEGVEPPIDHRDVTTIMRLLGDIQHDVARIRSLLEEDDGEEKEAPEDDA